MRLPGLRKAFVRVALPSAFVVAAFVVLVQLRVVDNPFGARIRGDLALARGRGRCLRVLFVGNSFTFANDMPTLVERLFETDDHPADICVVEYTRGGGRLEQAARDDRLADLLQEIRWDDVVLQEQSEIPSLPDDERERLMDGSVRDLSRVIRADGATPVLFMTWGYRGGDRRNVTADTYETMQARLERGYRAVATEIGAPVAPVGVAWHEALTRRPALRLWADDGKHPSRLGSYLAACVFYRLLSGRDPSRLTYAVGIDPRDAAFLRRVALDTATGATG